MFGLLVKAGVAGVVGAIAIKAIQQYELDKKLLAWGTQIADQALTSINNLNLNTDDPIVRRPSSVWTERSN